MGSSLLRVTSAAIPETENSTPCLLYYGSCSKIAKLSHVTAKNAVSSGQHSRKTGHRSLFHFALYQQRSCYLAGEIAPVGSKQLATESRGGESDEYDLYIKTIYVDSGGIIYRFLPAPQGRAYRVRKRRNHVTLVIENLVKLETEAEENQQNPDNEE